MAFNKQSRRQKALAYVAKNPDATIDDIVKHCGVTRHYAHNIRYVSKKNAAPVTAPAAPPVAETATPPVSTAAVDPRLVRYGEFHSVAMTTQHLMMAMRSGESVPYMSAPQAEALHMIARNVAHIVNDNPNHAESWEGVASYANLIADHLRAGGHSEA